MAEKMKREGKRLRGRAVYDGRREEDLMIIINIPMH